MIEAVNARDLGAKADLSLCFVPLGFYSCVKNCFHFSFFFLSQDGAGSVVQLVEHLLRMHKALTLIPSTAETGHGDLPL